LAFADAVYNREGSGVDRGERGYDGLEWANLPGTAREADRLEGIAAREGKGIVVYRGEEVSEGKVKELSALGELKKYPFVHFACHGYFDEEEPGRSAIVLSEVSGGNAGEAEKDGYLNAAEIVGLEFDSRMVLLSACETGLGGSGKMKRSEGVVGLARAFLTAGAGNVGVSLWKISDEGTVLFMEELYRKVLGEGKSFREAYHEVRNDFRQGKHGARYSRPYYWAAFTMYE
jgi:CHAT domain-containing protein